MPSRLNRRTFIQSAGAFAAGVTLARPQARALPAARSKKLNVVMMVADDQRNDTIAALGNDHIQTPALDRLVRDGFAFRRARCMGSQNPAVCVPTRAMLHTGRPLFQTLENLGDFVTLGQALRACGYRTFAAGKWHNGTPGFARLFSAGGNIFFGGMHADQFKMPVRDFDPAGKYPNAAVRVGEKFSSELFADAAVDFLAGHGREGPFFCYLAFTSPHDPRTPPAPYASMYDPQKMPLPKNWLASHPFDNGELAVRDEKLAPFPRTEADTRKQLCDYYGMITSQDAQVARVLKALDETGLADQTLVIYTGDHGLAIGSHGLFGKQNIYEPSHGIPMLLSGPGVPRGGSSDAFVYGFDLFATLCELLEIVPPASVAGHSLAGILSGAVPKVREVALSVYDHLPKAKNRAPGDAGGIQRAVNDGRWKLHHYHVRGQTTIRMFDLQNDPDEMHDLSTDPTAAGERGRVQALLAGTREAFGDTVAV